MVINGEGVRLRSIDLEKDMSNFLEWYANPDVLYYSDNPEARPYSPDNVRMMYHELSELGEAYIIEIMENNSWKPIGDAYITKSKIPITIGADRYWGKGIGTKVLALLIKRARELGMKKLHVESINEYNQRSLRLYSKAGFRETIITEKRGYKTISMELDL